MSASSQYYSVTARVGVPHRHEVEVTVPLVGPAGVTGPTGAAGASAWNDISGKPSTFAPSAHSSTHHTGGSDPLTPANIGAAKDFTEIEVGNSGTSTTTLTTAQLPARVILFIDAATAPSATINLPTPDARQSGLVASIKVQVEGGTADTALITVVHSAVNLLSAYSLAEDEGSIDFRWDGYRWVYDANWLLRSSTGRVLELPTTSGTLALTQSQDDVFRIVASADATKKVAFEVDGLTTATTRTLTVPNASGTIARTEDFGAPPAIGNTTPSTGSFTTLSANNGTITASAPVLDLSQTWNNSGVTFTGLAATITNTQSAAGSLVARFTVGSTNVFETDARGFTTLRKVATTTDFVNMFIVRRGTTEVFAVRDDGAINATAFFCPAGGAGHASMNADGYAVRSTGSFRISSDVAAFSPDVFLRRDAAGVFAQYNGTNAQEYRLYGTFTTATNYQRMTVKSVKQTLSALSGASATTTGTFIPDGAVVVGVTTRVTTAITGAAGYQVGDGTDADRWGDINATALNTTSDNANWTAGTVECFTAGGNVTLTANGSNFTAGAIEICVFYLAGQAD